MDRRLSAAAAMLMREFLKELMSKGIIQLLPDQVIISEYVPGEEIKPHKDRAYYETIFAP